MVMSSDRNDKLITQVEILNFTLQRNIKEKGDDKWLTWQAGSQGDKGDGSHSILKANGATEAASDVTDKASDHTDHQDGYSEAEPSTPVVWKPTATKNMKSVICKL